MTTSGFPRSCGTSGSRTSRDAYYTVATLGLVVQEDLGGPAEGEDEGNVLTDLFNNEAQDSLGLRLVSYDDEPPLSAIEAQPTEPVLNPTTDLGPEPGGGAAISDPLRNPQDEPAPAEQYAQIRLVHAATGVAPVSLVSTAGAAEAGGEPTSLVSDLAFAEASDYSVLEPAEANGLEVRIEGSAAAILPLGDVSLAPEKVYTLFVISTPVEDAPLETFVLGGEARGGGGNGGN